MKIDLNSSLFRNLSSTRKKLNTSYQKLASGSRLSAQNDPASLAIASGLSSQVRGLQTANRNIGYAQSSLQVADGALSEISSNLQRMRELALQSANGSLSNSDRANLQTEFDQLTDNINSVSSQAKFGGTSLLDGSFSQSIQSGPNAGDQSSVSIDRTDANSLGVQEHGIATQEGAQDALAAIDEAIARVNSQRASLGARSNSLEFTSNANAIQAENLAAAESQLSDLDYAEEISELNRLRFQQEAQLQTLKSQLKSEKDKHSLLFKPKA